MPGAGRGDHRLPGGNPPRARPRPFRNPSRLLPGVPGVRRTDASPGSALRKADRQVTRAGNCRLAAGRIPSLERLANRAVTSGAGRGLHLHPTRHRRVKKKEFVDAKRRSLFAYVSTEEPAMRTMTLRSSARWLASILLAIAVVLVGIAWYGSSPVKAEAATPGVAHGLGQLSGLLAT